MKITSAINGIVINPNWSIPLLSVQAGRSHPTEQGSVTASPSTHPRK
jgi:hypothetical protein